MITRDTRIDEMILTPHFLRYRAGLAIEEAQLPSHHELLEELSVSDIKNSNFYWFQILFTALNFRDATSPS